MIRPEEPTSEEIEEARLNRERMPAVDRGELLPVERAVLGLLERWSAEMKNEAGHVGETLVRTWVKGDCADEPAGSDSDQLPSVPVAA